MIKVQKYGLNNFRITVGLPGPIKEREVDLMLTMAVSEFQERPTINMSATGEFLPEGVPLLVEALELAQNILQGKIGF